jgi:hypothetical protein
VQEGSNDVKAAPLLFARIDDRTRALLNGLIVG